MIYFPFRVVLQCSPTTELQKTRPGTPKDIFLEVYHVEGVRHFVAIFASSLDEAVFQAVEHGLVGSWETPCAVEESDPAT